MAAKTKVQEINTTHCNLCNRKSKSVFCNLGISELDQINQHKVSLSFKKGEEIFKENTYPKGLFCIDKGKVKIIQTGLDGREQILHFAKESDIMGYRAILGDDKYSCSAIAMEDSSICFIPTETFKNLVEKNSSLAVQVIHLLTKELKESETKITNIAQLSVKERISQSIWNLKECYGFEEDNKSLNIQISREELANISGTTRETATRALLELKEDRIVDLIGKKIIILNFELLLQSAKIFL